MRILDRGNFIKEENDTLKNDGVLFEDLVENLLNLEFGHLDWNRTKASWDGAKDFVGRKNGIPDVWAECKMYQNTLQLAVISKTLVMAINYQINRIIIFSWSKLTPNTLKELANFSSVCNTQLQIFDDGLLEALIIKHINSKTIKGFFPNLNEQKLQNIALKAKVDQFFCTDIHIDSSQVDHSKDITNPRSNQIYINTPCSFQITIYPNNIEPANIIINLDKLLDKEYELGILNKDKLNIDKDDKISKKLEPGEIYSLRIYFAPSKKGNHEIPICSIIVNNEKLKTDVVKFNVGRLSRPTLVGANIEQELKKIHAKISSNNLVYTTVINGLSGVGKSRFLEECISKLLKENYRICKFDGRSIQCKNFNTFVVELLTQLWRLPNPEIFKEECTSLELSTSKDDYSTYSNLYEVIKICTFSEQTSVDNIKDKIYHLFIEGFLKSSRIAILIDNVQSLDNKSIALVRELVKQTGRIGQNVSILAFNTEDLIYSHEAFSFYQNLKEELTIDSNGSFFTIDEFSEKEIKLFVDTHLKSISTELTFSQQYPSLFALICDHIQPRPLDLYLFFHLLTDKKVVELDDGIFYIDDFEEFNKILRGVEKNTENILEQRLVKLYNDEECLNVLIFLLYFGEVDIDSLADCLGIKYETIEKLQDGCWIKESTDKKMEFYHPKIERFIISKESAFSKEKKAKIFTILSNNIEIEKFPLVNFVLNPSKAPILHKAIDKLLELSTLNARNKLFATKIYNYITNKFSNVSPSIYLRAIQKICDLTAENNKSVKIEKLSCFNEKLKDYVPADSEATSYFHVIRQLASYLCDEAPYNSINIINDGLCRLNELKGNFPSEVVDFIQMNLKNRLSFCYRTIRNEEKAKKIGEEALAIAKKINNIPFICLCYIDLGYTFLGFAKDKNRLIEYWGEAVRLYRHHRENIFQVDFSIALGVMIVEAYLYAIENEEYTKAINKAEEIISLSKECFYMHTEILGILSKTIFEFKLYPNTYNEIITLADNLIDKCLISYDSKNQSKGYHLKAIALSKQGRRDKEAFVNFKYGLKILEKKKYLSVSDEALICDAVFFLKQHRNLEDQMFSYDIVKRKRGYNKLQDFGKIDELITPFMIFADNEYNFPV
ncbi:MAG: restriction endonuclease [Dysgonamonadaceae bacterium]|jgi:tetratricopeptide (TPR) repeat protein|nr:restriction endonuclease [Dysgonamonadaceae bacterium]